MQTFMLYTHGADNNRECTQHFLVNRHQIVTVWFQLIFFRAKGLALGRGTGSASRRLVIFLLLFTAWLCEADSWVPLLVRGATFSASSGACCWSVSCAWSTAVMTTCCSTQHMMFHMSMTPKHNDIPGSCGAQTHQLLLMPVCNKYSTAGNVDVPAKQH